MGDRVRCIKPAEELHKNWRPVGKTGVVVSIFGTIPPIGVCFNENIDGHDLHGNCKDGYGYYFDEECLVKVENNNVSKWFD